MTISETTKEAVTSGHETDSDGSRQALVRIRPIGERVSLNTSDLWGHRQLLYFLIWRDLKVRYKQTALGVVWAILEPFISMVVFSIFFGGLAGVPSDGLPYPIWSYAGLVPWTFFANGLAKSSNSLVGNADLLRKVYFPRLILPTASVLSDIVDFLIAFMVLIGMMLYYGIVPRVTIIFLPLFLLLAIITSLGSGLWLAPLNVKYRDIRFVVPLLLRVWMFATPVVYPSSLLSEPWQTLYGLNPMVGVIEGFRWALLDTDPPRSMIFLSALVAVALFGSGLYFFRQAEETFADVV
ncbi:MAG TPA: phosphate ABC transporter permease [Chloroflexi bacterium]|jgi:lipopolysaccharide transport system permease protein|nr:phosphate ABC transporter permease [Chloroflexota bacterium]